jgi:hypothetical protein
MAAELITLPFRPVINTRGVLEPGALLDVFQSGTTTRVSVFADAGLTSELTNPVVADGAGVFPTVYFDNSQAVRVRVRRAPPFEETVIGNADPYFSDGLSSTDISFQQSGAGAVARPVQAKLRDAVSVKDFGAIGDGVTDDSTAFTNAIAAGRDVYIPAGTYRITPRTFSGLASLKVTGAGRDSTRIVLTSTGTALTFSNCQWLQLSDFSIQADGFPQTLVNANGIELNTSSSNCVIERVNFYGFSLDGLRLVGTALATLSGNTVQDCYFLGNGRNQAYETHNNDATWMNNQHGRLQSVGMAAFGMLSESCGENIITGCKMWDNTRDLKIVNAAAYRIADCRIEEAQQENLWLENANDVQIVGCRIHTGSKVGDGVADYVYLLNCARVTITGNNINTWNASFGRWAVNVDGNCSSLNWSGNTLGGFSPSFGPIRVAGATTDVSGDLLIMWTATGVAAGATVYPSVGGNTAEGAAWRPLNRRYAAVRIYAGTTGAPGAGQSYTYTLRKNAVDTAMVATSSGAGSFSAAANTPAPQILFAEGDFLSTKLVASGGAAVADHRGYAVLVAY